MDFQRFPPEIRQMIISHWAADATHRSTSCGFQWPLSMFAGLSQDWQHLVEEHSFATITLRTRDFLSGTAKKYLSHRLGYVRSLLIILSFSDSHHLNGCPCADCITEAIFGLLESALSKRSCPHIDLSIELESRAISSRYDMGRGVGTSQPKCFRIKMPERPLPEAPAVRSLTISAPSGLLFVPSSACRIASRMTKLVSFVFNGIWCNTFPGQLAKLVEREKFAQAVELLPVSLRDISINYVDWIEPHNLSPDDKLSSALCELPRQERRENLTAFSVTGSVGLSIVDSSDLPCTRNLSSFRVQFECNGPDVDSTFFRRMAKRGASAARLLPRQTLVQLEYDGCYLIYDHGRLYYCEDEGHEPGWDVEDWKITAFHHKHELTLLVNTSPSDDEDTNHSDDDANDEHYE